jgi:hypothetical protein
MVKTVTLTLSANDYAIISAMLIDSLCDGPAKRAIAAAEKVHDVMPVAEGSEEMASIVERIVQAANSFLDKN